MNRNYNDPSRDYRSDDGSRLVGRLQQSADEIRVIFYRLKKKKAVRVARYGIAFENLRLPAPTPRSA